MTDDVLNLVPYPRKVTPKKGVFLLKDSTPIVLPKDFTDATHFAARQLQAEIEAVTGLEPGIVPGEYDSAITFVIDDALPPQGYTLKINACCHKGCVCITGGDDAGLFYGVQTLRQMVRQFGRALPSLEIADDPVLPNRGLMLDVSRRKVPTVETLFDLVDFLSEMKMNQLQLYMEHTFFFPSHPKIGAGASPLTADDVLALDEYCKQRHVELVPNLNLFGHQRDLLSIPEYSRYAETGWNWTFATNDETYEFINDLLSEFLPNFSSEIFNAGSDETYDMGLGQSAEEMAEKGKGRYYLDHILRLRQLAAAYGKRLQIWGDILLHHPETVEDVPDDVILLDWQYYAADHYPSVEIFAESGRTFYVCPGVSTWRALYPLLDKARTNIRNFTKQGIEGGAIGMLNTDWGDLGHWHPLSYAYHGYGFGAEMAWTGCATTDEDFDRAFNALYYGAQVQAALNRFAHATTPEGLFTGNGSYVMDALFEDPIKIGTESVAEAADEVWDELQDAARAAMQTAAMLSRTAFDDLIGQELAFGAWQADYVVRKMRVGKAIRALLKEMDGHDAPQDAALQKFDGLITRLEALAAEAGTMAGEFEQLWLERARPSEIEVNLERYEGLLERFELALDWLDAQRAFYLVRPVDIDEELITYSVEGYTIFEMRGGTLRELYDIVGDERFPEQYRGWIGLE